MKKKVSPTTPAQLDLDLLAPAHPQGSACPEPKAPSPTGSKSPAPRILFDLSEPTTSSSSEPRVWKVSSLTANIRKLLEQGFGNVWVEGEISNLRTASSGTRYFTLKDEISQLRCVLFRGSNVGSAGLTLSDGQLVEAFGLLTVYEAQGQYQLQVQCLRFKGAGELAAKFEALKLKLQREGLFDATRKRPLPPFPVRIGVVTSPTGAAIRDFLQVLHRRNPGIAVLINPVRVQGAGAAVEIAEAIRQFAKAQSYGWPWVDVIVVTRGGGSLEDLWEFNEEVVARAIAESPIPVVSAVGHEIDFTICDFVADYRAPTPSAAAEILSADSARLGERLAREASRLASSTHAALKIFQTKIQAASKSALFRDPPRRIFEALQSLDRLESELLRGASTASQARQQTLEKLSARFRPSLMQLHVSNYSTRLDYFLRKLNTAANTAIESQHATLDRLVAQLEALSPASTLARGYTYTTNSAGQLLRSAAVARTAQTLITHFSDGSITSCPKPSEIQPPEKS